MPSVPATGPRAPSAKAALKVVTGAGGNASVPRTLPARKASLPSPASTGAVPRTTATRIVGTATLTTPIRAAKGGQRVVLAVLAVVIVGLLGLLVWMILKG